MGTTPINIVIDNTKITQTTRPYNGEALAIPTDAVAVYDDKTGALVTDIQLTYVWKNKKGQSLIMQLTQMFMSYMLALRVMRTMHHSTQFRLGHNLRLLSSRLDFNQL